MVLINTDPVVRTFMKALNPSANQEVSRLCCCKRSCECICVIVCKYVCICKSSGVVCVRGSV